MQPDDAYKVVEDGVTVTKHKPYPGKVLKQFTGECYALLGRHREDAELERPLSVARA